MIIETHPDYVVLRSDSAVFRREDGSETRGMKFEVRLDYLQSLTATDNTYALIHEHGEVRWTNYDDDDIILKLEI